MTIELASSVNWKAIKDSSLLSVEEIVLGRGRFLAIKQYTYKSVNLPSCPVKVIFPSPPIRVASTNMISPPIAVHAKPSETNNHLFQLSSKWYLSLQYYPHIRTELYNKPDIERMSSGKGWGERIMRIQRTKDMYSTKDTRTANFRSACS